MAATADLVFPQNAPPSVPRFASPNPGLIDQRVRLSGVAWGDHQRLLDLRGDRAVPRLTYLNGDLELMPPSVDHEGQKTRLGRLIEECIAAASQTEALGMLRARLDA